MNNTLSRIQKFSENVWKNNKILDKSLKKFKENSEENYEKFAVFGKKFWVI